MVDQPTPYQRADPNGQAMLHLVYGLYALGFLTAVTSIAAAILAYFLRKNDLTAMQKSHVTWQIRTFFLGLLVGVIAFASLLLLGLFLGLVMFGMASIWSIYRIVKGWYFLSKHRPIEKPDAFL